MSLEIKYSGNDTINRQIRESYFPTLMQYAYAYQVAISGKIVGYYMIRLRTIKMHQVPEEISDYSSSIIADIGAVHISYIAVDKIYQKKNIGTSILKMIIAQVLNMCQWCPITLITLDALREKYEWYKKRGFAPFDEKELDSDEITIPMYVKCILNEKAVNDYSVY